MNQYTYENKLPRRVEQEQNAKRLQKYWHDLGHKHIRFWVEEVLTDIKAYDDYTRRVTTYEIRSNLNNGLPL